MRKKYYVVPDIQKKFIIFLIIEVTIISVFLLFLMFYNYRVYSNLLFTYTNVSPEITAQIKHTTNSFVLSMIILIIGNGFLIGLVSLFFSHKMVGPLCRLQRLLKVIEQEGKIPESFNIRKDDFPKNLSKNLSEFFKFLKGNEEKKKNALNKLEEIISSSSLEKDKKEEVNAIIKEIKK